MEKVFSGCGSVSAAVSCSCAVSRCCESACKRSSISVISALAVVRMVSRDAFSSLISLSLLQPATYPKEQSEVSSPKCWHTVKAMLSASTSRVRRFGRFSSSSGGAFRSMSCSFAWAISWIRVLIVCSSLIPSSTAMRLSVRL